MAPGSARVLPYESVYSGFSFSGASALNVLREIYWECFRGVIDVFSSGKIWSPLKRRDSDSTSETKLYEPIDAKRK